MTPMEYVYICYVSMYGIIACHVIEVMTPEIAAELAPSKLNKPLKSLFHFSIASTETGRTLS